MAKPTKPIINVYPNPWCARDAADRPCGAVPFDVVDHVDLNGFVGARRRATITRTEQVKTFRGRVTGKPLEVVTIPGRQDTTIEFLGIAADKLTPELLLKQPPVAIPLTATYRKRMLHGELLAADQDAARHAGLPFVEPAILLERACAGLHNHDLKALAASAAGKRNTNDSAGQPARKPPGGKSAGTSED